MSDSRHWDDYAPRGDDIFISKPPKCGTTWMQGIVSSLLWSDGDARGPPMDISPWFDVRFTPRDQMLARLDSIRHRRFVKTHSSADAIVIFPDCRYLAVYREPADALLSWANHRAKLRPEVTDAMNTSAIRDGMTPRPGVWSGDVHELLDEVEQDGTIFEHLASWWPYRHEDFLLLIHYADLVADLNGEMRRIAAFLDLDVPLSKWPDVVRRCRFNAMRKSHEDAMSVHTLEGGSDSFFHYGENGRGRQQLPEGVIQRLDDLSRAQLPDDQARHWLTIGSLAAGWRPDS
jgi:aryl sulfotransferase